MGDVVETSSALLRKFAEFTKKLTPEQLEAVVAGELKFGLLNPPPKKAAPALKVDAEQVRTDLNATSSRTEAAAYVDGLKLAVGPLKELARQLGASIAGAPTKVAVRDRIVEHAIGYRLNSAAMRS